MSGRIQGGDPLLSIGIPVFNGEDYISEALDSILRQDFADFEVVVYDNCSNDRTPEIVNSYSQRDQRVKFIGRSENVGAARNYNDVFHASRGDLFAWNAHDDMFSSDFMSGAIEALERDQEAVVAIGRAFRVHADGEVEREIPVSDNIFSDSAAVRFRAAARGKVAPIVFGLYRRSVLERTHLHGAFTGSDRNFAAELMLHGKPSRSNRGEFYLRQHSGRSVGRLKREADKGTQHVREAWFDPARSDKMVFPNWRRVGAYLAAISTAPLGFGTRFRCYVSVVQLLFDDRMVLLKQMVQDLIKAAVFLWRRGASAVRSTTSETQS